MGDLNADLKKENTKSAGIIRKMEKFMSNPTVVSENKFTGHELSTVSEYDEGMISTSHQKLYI